MSLKVKLTGPQLSKILIVSIFLTFVNPVLAQLHLEDSPLEVAKQTILNLNRELILRTGESPLAVQKQLSEAQLVLAFDGASTFKSIKKRGFLNLHQTLQSGGDNDPEVRIQIENTLSNLNISENPTEHEKTLLPKYSYIDFGHKSELSRWTQYGNVFAILKDSTKQRATWLPFDSLSFKYMNMNHSSLIESGYLNTFNQSHGIKRKGSYYEAQIWGPLTLMDVREIVIPAYFLTVPPDMDIHEILNKIELLTSEINISVYKEGPSTETSMNLAFRNREPLHEQSIQRFIDELNIEYPTILNKNKTNQLLRRFRKPLNSCSSVF